MHPGDPSAAEKLPVEQSVQEVAPAFEYAPAKQSAVADASALEAQ